MSFKNYSIVFQDVNLFNNTIIENIRIGRKDATNEEVLEAAKKENCDEFVSKLPNGHNTYIGENGAELSGGERQRISIARALLKDAPIVLLDEATASLDAENETIVQEAISNATKGKTVIVIAHRMRTIENADKVIVLNEGKVVEVQADTGENLNPIETTEGVEDTYDEETTQEISEVIPAESFNTDFESLAVN